ncbi:MAG: ParB/RepB/Spo0J family partition protein [Pyrinomonadaceae bacterium]|nr:ParB/RepB/Spo0J family partition protein [Phycisphaerales bacterium]
MTASHPSPDSSNIEQAKALEELQIDQIHPNKYQPRRTFEHGSLQRLADSIQVAGVMQPVLVREADASGGGTVRRYELIAGERRWRAAKLAGLSVIPAIIARASDEESAEWALIENLQRDDLAPMEKAWALRSLAEKFSLTHGEVAGRVGLDRSSVTNTIRLTELEPEIVALLDQRRLSLGHAKALLTAPGGAGRIEMGRRAAEEEWSVRKLERMASAASSAVGREAPGVNGKSASPERALEKEAGVRDLEQQLTQYLGTKVELNVMGKGEKGKVVISFFGLDHFDSLMSKIGFQSR